MKILLHAAVGGVIGFVLFFLLAVATPDSSGDWAEWRVGLFAGAIGTVLAGFISWIDGVDL